MKSPTLCSSVAAGLLIVLPMGAISSAADTASWPRFRGPNGDGVCLEFATGRIVWKPEKPGQGSAAVLYADGQLYFRYDKGGLVALIEATPDAYRLNGAFTAPTGGGPAWPHPVIHDGRLYLRHKDLLMCYDVRRK